MNKKNGMINIIKFVFAINIMFLHLSFNFGYDKILYFQGSFILVEWFFIFSGYTLAKKVLNLDRNVSLANTSFDIIFKRIKKIYPYYFLSCIIAIIVKIYYRQIIITNSWDVYKIINDLLFLQMIGIDYTNLLQVEWFLSSLWIALIIIVPILVKYRHMFSKTCIILTVIIYFYIGMEEGNLYGPGNYMFLGYKGNFRAIAAICIGIFAYEAGILLRGKMKFPVIENIFCFITYGIILWFINKKWVESSLNSLLYFIIPFIFAMLISMQMNIKTSVLIVDSTITKLMGTFSMILYMNHGYLQYLIEQVFVDMSLFDKVKLSIILSIIISFVVYFIINFISMINNVYCKKFDVEVDKKRIPFDIEASKDDAMLFMQNVNMLRQEAKTKNLNKLSMNEINKIIDDTRKEMKKQRF